MGTIKEKVTYLLDTKVLIKAALQTAGAKITEDTPFRRYADFIQGLVPSGQEDTLNVMQVLNLIQVHNTGGVIYSAAELFDEYNKFAEIAQEHMQGALK